MLSSTLIKEMIKQHGAKVIQNCCYEYEQYKDCSALMVASLRGLYDETSLIIRGVYNSTRDQEVSVYYGMLNQQDGNGQSSLMFASLKGHGAVAELLLKQGAWVDQQDKNGKSALMLASSNGKTDTAKVLLEKGADIDLQDEKGLSALMHACKNIQSNTAKLLIDKGADVDQQSKDWESAMSLALRHLQSESENKELIRRQSELISSLEKKIDQVRRFKLPIVITWCYTFSS